MANCAQGNLLEARWLGCSVVQEQNLTRARQNRGLRIVAVVQVFLDLTLQDIGLAAPHDLEK